MTDKHSVKDELIKSYVGDYFGKVFYFCLKKTGNSLEAEDLSSDISLNILQALGKGTIPSHFSAWVWQIVRNRYSVWASRKHHTAEAAADTDINDMEIRDEKAGIEEGVIHSENLALLRRELAFLTSDYRDIVVAYYVEDRKTRDIAASLNLPRGTVESKLFRARKILKEGMDMAREFGVKSYKPEAVEFASSGGQTSGLPWSAVKRKLPKNILLEASRNPSTIEELSMELGIAMPYMEEEVGLLVDAGLLKKVENKYVTNFFILSKECQMEIYLAQRKHSKERSAIADAIISETLGQIRNLGVVRNQMSDEDLKWWALIHGVDYFIESLDVYNIQYPVKHSDGGDWGFVGFENTELPENCGMSHCGTGEDSKAMFWTYKIPDYNMWNRVGEMNREEALFLGEIVKNNRKISTFTDFEKRVWKRIENRFAHGEEDGSVTPDMVVLDRITLDRIHEIWKSHLLYEKAMAGFKEVFDDTAHILEKENTPVLKAQLTYCASMCTLNIRMMIVHDEVENGRLVVPEDVEHSKVAMMLRIM